MIEKIYILLFLCVLTSCSNEDRTLILENTLAGSPVMGGISWSCNGTEYEIYLSSIEGSVCGNKGQVSPKIAALNAIEYAESSLDLGISDWWVESVTVYFRKDGSSYFLVTLVSPYESDADYIAAEHMEIGVSTCGDIVPPRKWVKPQVDPM